MCALGVFAVALSFKLVSCPAGCRSRGLSVDCARCHERIQPAQEWDLGDVDGDGLRYARP